MTQQFFVDGAIDTATADGRKSEIKDDEADFNSANWGTDSRFVLESSLKSL